jgi:WhiB family redox-sensing transcriptional regulator
MSFLDKLPYLDNLFPDFKEHGTPPCAETDPELFFPPDEFNTLGRSNSSNPSLSIAKSKEAIKICNTCPYIEECLKYAMERPNLFGVWGGTTYEQRRRIKTLERSAGGERGRPRKNDY